MLARACRNGITDCVGWLTHWISDASAPHLRAREMWDDGGESGAQHGRRHPYVDEGDPMSKRGRKRRSRKGSAANHGNRPNA